jgi:methylmalonyl-CoA mutase
MRRVPDRPVRIVTAVASYDGHDASVLALNRALLSLPVSVEVIYLGFNMSAERIADAAVQEGADAVAVSSYNGGHLQFYPYLVRRLAEKGSAALVFGGGGGTIHPEDAGRIEAQGATKIYGPGWPLDEIAADLVGRVKRRWPEREELPVAMPPEPCSEKGAAELARLLSVAARGGEGTAVARKIPRAGEKKGKGKAVIVTGDGGSGKSTLIDEFVRRFLDAFGDKSVAVLANDPTVATESGAGAFLADRVRMNNIYEARVFMHSVATGTPYAPCHPALPEMVRLLRGAGFDLILVETPGTGQAGIDLAPFDADLSLHVKSRDFGGDLQLEKDQLLRTADLVALNKLDLEGAESAYQQLGEFLGRQGKGDALFGATAKLAHDPGLDRLFAALCRRLGWPSPEAPEREDVFCLAKRTSIVPHARRSYLAQVAQAVRNYDAWTREQLRLVREAPGDLARLDPHCRALLEGWPRRWEELSRQAAEKTGADPFTVTPNGLRLPKVALPEPADLGESLRFLLEEGLPGAFPYATGIYPFRPETAGETTRQFAGMRGPEETNRRLHYLANGVARPRLSIAFDGITLYGGDSDDDPGSIGKIGEGGVSVDSWEDMKLILKGFRIAEISTSMTINGPAPVVLAMYFVAAMEIEEERAEREQGRALTEGERTELRARTLRMLRGTVQADILKEVQAQNECIFQSDFAVRLLGDVQEFFDANDIRRFYSLSVSGYHIGEAGATPVRELAFTLANGFTYVEHFLSRGLKVDRFAPSLSFFFRVSHEAEWLAYGAVCRKLWAIAMRDVYRGGEGAQKFKFHTQTSGRALQAEEWDTLNPLRQSYHALLALLANTNSLHVDSADEPMTTPGEKYVRQATMVPNYLREEAEGFVIQNLLSGSYAFRALMREVQSGVLDEFERIDRLGGVAPATEQGYHRRAIAENSERYERQRRRPTPEHPEQPARPIIGYNAYALPEGDPGKYPTVGEVVRPERADWERQLARLRDFRERHREDAPVYLQRLRQKALAGENVFAELLESVRHATLGQIVRTLAEVGGRYRKMV